MRTRTMTAAALVCLGIAPASAYNPNADRTPYKQGEKIAIVTDWRTMAKETRTCELPGYRGWECLTISGGPIKIIAKDGQKFTCSGSIAKNTRNGTFGCRVASPVLLKVNSGAEVRCPEKVELDDAGNVDSCQEKSKKVYP